MKKIIITIILAFLLNINCSSTIEYKLEDINLVSSSNTRDIIISIQPFKNTWIDNPYHQGRLPDKNGPRHVLTRSDVSDYENTDIGSLIAEMLAKHLDQINAFKKIVFNNNKMADYYIIANLECFHFSITADRNEYDDAKKTLNKGSKFGIVGAAISYKDMANLKSKYHSLIIYSDIKLFSKNGECILSFGNHKSSKTVAGEFKNVNNNDLNIDLKQHNENFIKKYLDQISNVINSL